MFLIDDASIAAVQTAFSRGGELVAMVELRERFPGLTDHAAALGCVHQVLAMRLGAEAEMLARLAALKSEKRPRRREPVSIW